MLRTVARLSGTGQHTAPGGQYISVRSGCHSTAAAPNSVVARGSAVARYYFHLVRDNEIIRDDQGEEFDLVQEARAHAVQVARELSRNVDPAKLAGRAIVAVDSNDVVVFRTDLATLAR